MSYQDEIYYSSALQLAKEVIVDMQKTLNKYKAKENANQKWAEERQRAIINLLDFIETSNETIKELQLEINEVKNAAYKHGYDNAQKALKHKEEYGNLSFYNPEHKERIRAASILNAQLKWNF